jgi:biopolymer transport protein ExbD
MDEKEFDYINVIPFVDIMLVLLTIVLTTSTLIAAGSIPLQLPQASGNREDLLRIQTIEIDRNGAIYYNAAPVCQRALFEALDNVDRSTPILIRADRKIALQTFVNVLDVVKTQGFNRVSLQTESAR